MKGIVEMSTEELIAQIEAQMAATGVPGVAVGLLHRGEKLTACAGVTNIHHPLPVDADTLFQIGSITKTMTAIVAMRLVEQGKLALDEPIRTYLPTFALQDEEVAARATLRHLFTHLGGWVGDYFEETGRGEDALARYVANMAQLPQQAPLGKLWSYNNAGFSLAGRLIEVVTGQSYETVMQELLFEPLGMSNAFFFASDLMTHRFVVGHTVVDDKAGLCSSTVASPWALARSTHPAGGVTASINDMLTYAQFCLSNGQSATGERLLQPQSVNTMQSIQAEAGSMAGHVGISWLLSNIDGRRTVGHSGATNGQIAQLLLIPEREFALVILTNANRGREVTRDLSEWILANLLDLHQAKPEIQPTTATTREAYVGYYSAQLSDVEIQPGEEGLLLQVLPKGGFPDKHSPAGPKPPVATAGFVAPDTLCITDGPSAGSRAEFIRNDDGSIGWLRFGGRIHARR